uniref:Uncharacterized protein n=1 Tax=Anopheles minimus TaxID=112268 RepID=A0A182W3Z3_9DIPT
MLSYMLPVEEKSPSAAAAAATRNLSLNLTTTTTTTGTGVGGGSSSGGGGGGAGGAVTTGGAAAGATIVRDHNAGSGSGAATTASTSSAAQVRSIIKPTIKHGATHRYQLIGGGSDVKQLGAGGVGSGVERGTGRWQEEADGEVDLCDESTNLLAGGEDEDDDERVVVDDRSRRGGAVKSDKNFNNLILVTNGRHTKPTNGNHAGPTPKLASVLKPTNGVGSGVRPGSSTSNSGTGSAHTSTSGGAYYNGYIAVSGENDDEHHRLLVSANNLRNTSVESRQDWNAHSRTGPGEGPGTAVTTDPPRSSSTFTSTSRTNGNCRTMNSLNGNLMGSDPPVVAPLPLETSDIAGGGGGGAADVSLGSDSDSATGAGGSTTTGGGKKVKLNKLGGNKNVTLKR